MMPDDELFLRLERESQQSADRLRALLREEGREDLIPEFDQRMRDIRLGLDSARGCWHALSSKQRFVLARMGAGRYIARSVANPRVFHAYQNGTEALSGQPGAILAICRLSTARAIAAHKLIHVAGGAFDPEAKFVITERGQFVLKHGAAQ